MPVVSPVRLFVLRAMYTLLAVGLGLVIWPSILSHSPVPPSYNTVIQSLLGSIGLLAAAGIWRPLQMLPLLVFEFAWKFIWVVGFAVPAWAAGNLGAYGHTTLLQCLPAFVLIPLAVPWRYLFAAYFKGQPGSQQARGDA